MNEPRGPVTGAPWLDEPCERHEQQDCRECADERYQEPILTVVHVSSNPCRITLALKYESHTGDAPYPPVEALLRLHEHDGVVGLCVVGLYEVAP